jgi:hypothetical protein
MLGFHFYSGKIFCPQHEVINRLLRSVSVINFQPKPERDQLVLRVLQSSRRFRGQDALRLLVAVDTLPYKTVFSLVTCFYLYAGNGVLNVDESIGQLHGRGGESRQGIQVNKEC